MKALGEEVMSLKMMSGEKGLEVVEMMDLRLLY